MKNKQLIFRLILSLSVVVILGCSIFTPGGTPATPEVDRVATAVAETMVANRTADAPAPGTEGEAPTITITPSATETPVEPAVRRLGIAYLDSNRNIWVWQEGEASRQLTTSNDVTSLHISADGAWVAFVRSADMQHESLWVIRTDGSGERVVVDEAGFEALSRPAEAITTQPFEIQWVPDSALLAFNTYPIFEGLGLMVNDDLWVANAETGEVSQRLPPGSGGMFYYSPDGEQIALVTPSTISLIDADGTNRRDAVLRYERVSTYSEYHFYAVPQWSPDSSFLRVFIPASAALEHPDDQGIVWHIPTDGSPAREVLRVVTAPLMHAVLSPDLNQFAYLRSMGDPSENRRELHLVSIEPASDTAYLAENMMLFNGWAADSSRFAFTVGQNNRPYLGRAGESPQALADAASILQFQWLDASRYIFTVKSGINFELKLGSTAGSSQLIVAMEVWPSFDFTR